MAQLPVVAMGRRTVLLICLLFSGFCHSAPGSWVVNADNLRLGVVGRWYSTSPLQPPGLSSGRGVEITSVWWRYHLDLWHAAEVELCRGSLCVPLATAQGRSDVFSGSVSGEPFFFRARRLDKSAALLALTGLQLIVNHR